MPTTAHVNALADVVREFREGLLALGFQPAACGELVQGPTWVSTTYGNWEFYVTVWFRTSRGPLPASGEARWVFRVHKPEVAPALADLAVVLGVGDTEQIIEFMSRDSVVAA